MTGPDAQANPKAARLAQEAAAAANLRALSTNPDVIALRVEKVRDWVDRLMWTAIVLGLGFTMVNVQTFAAAGAPPRSLEWWAAWLLDPMVSLALIAVLLAEQVTNRWGVRVGRWGRAARWLLLAATYAMNTWESLTARDPAAIVLHSVPPLLVFLAAEAVTDLREALNRAVTAAATAAAELADAHATEPARGTLFIDDTPTIPFPVVSSPPPREEEAEEPEEPEEPQENEGEETGEEEAPSEPPRPELTGKKIVDARNLWEHERAQGRKRSASWVNDEIDSEQYVKKQKHVDVWEREWQERHQRTLSVVGGR